MDEKNTILIPLRVPPSMAADLTAVAGGERKRAEYIRSVLKARLEAAKAQDAAQQRRQRLLVLIDEVGDDDAVEAALQEQLRAKESAAVTTEAGR